MNKWRFIFFDAGKSSMMSSFGHENYIHLGEDVTPVNDAIFVRLLVMNHVMR